MIYPQNFESRIEFDAIRQMLKERCLGGLGHERVDDMQFMTDYTAVNTRLDEVVECYENAGYEIIDRAEREDWRALKLKRA